MGKIKIAVLGFGNVGKGVWKILQENKKEISKRAGREVEISRILVKDMDKDRGITLPEGLLTDNIHEILQDEEIEIVVELTGDTDIARDYMLESMKRKKHVVTANKLVLAKWGDELFTAAAKEEVKFYYEACVAGGIPIIREINESLTANKIEKIAGIVNGTTNYILSKMTLEGMDFEAALKEAQQKGYAEADPTSDVQGFDAVYKLAILASLAFGTKIDCSRIYREGIENISAADIHYARSFGYVVKLLAIAAERDNRLELRVHPALVPASHPIANVNDTFNAIFIKGNAVGDLMLYGRGAGDLPTGSAVIGDIISIIRCNTGGYQFIMQDKETPVKEIKHPEEIETEYYIRFNVRDVAGVLGSISTVFGHNNVSIISVTQDIKHKDNVPLVFITHTSSEKDMRKSLKEILEIGNVNSIDSVLRIEQF
ncbi:MAG: homoserine dehydrogenase [Bacillota bacterium]